MKHKIDPAQLRLQLELDARIHFVERARKDVVEMLAQLLLTAVKAYDSKSTLEEACDEDR